MSSPLSSLPWSLSLSLWQEFALLALGLLSLGYAVLFRVWAAEALVADGVFALAVAALVAAIAFPAVFDGPGARIVEWSPLPKTLEDADQRAVDLASLPGRLIDRVLERIGFAGDEEPPADPVTGAEVLEAQEPGWLSAHVRPSVDGLVALLLRVATATTASLVLLVALLLRLTTTLARRLRRIGERLAALEAANASRTPGADAIVEDGEPA